MTDTARAERSDHIVQARFRERDLELLDELAGKLSTTRSSVLRLAVRSLDDQLAERKRVPAAP